MDELLNNIRHLDNEHQALGKGVVEVMKLESRKEDYHTPFGAINFSAVARGNQTLTPFLTVEGNRGVPTFDRPLNDYAFSQLSEKLGVDIRTARRLLQIVPETFVPLMNSVLRTKENEQCLLRTFSESETHRGDGLVRGVLSPKYKIVDNFDLLKSILPSLCELEGNWEAVKANISDTKLLVNFRAKNIVAEPAVGDTMALGIQISNSEVGSGSVGLEQLLFTLACLNGMQSSNKLRKTHLGGARTQEQVNILSETTREKLAEATLSEVQDNLKHFAKRSVFDEEIEKMRRAHADILPSNVDKSTLCDNVVKLLDHNKKDSALLLESLIKTQSQSGYINQPLSRATLINGVTGIANLGDRFSNPDVQQQAQIAGNKILNLSARAWHSLTQSAIPDAIIA